MKAVFQPRLSRTRRSGLRRIAFGSGNKGASDEEDGRRDEITDQRSETLDWVDEEAGREGETKRRIGRVPRGLTKGVGV